MQVPPKATQHPDRRTALRTIMRAWLPLSACVLDMVVERLPDPREAAPERLPRLLPPPSMQHMSPEQAQVQLSSECWCNEVQVSSECRRGENSSSMQHLSPEQAQARLSAGFRCSEVSSRALA